MDKNLLEKKEEKKMEDVKKNNTSKKENKENNAQLEGKHTKFQVVNEKSKKIDQEIEKMEENKIKKSNNKYIIIAIIIGIVLLIGIGISTVFALVDINNEKMISGVSISGVEVSGLSKDEAKAKIETMYNEKKQNEIDIKYQDYETSLNTTLMEVNYNIDKAVEDAYQIGRKENIFINIYEILLTLIAKRDINVEMSLNEEVAKQTIEDINVNLPGVIIESSYSIEDDELIITKGKAGKSRKSSGYAGRNCRCTRQF